MNDTNRFDNLISRLKSELNLIDTDEYIKRKEREAVALRGHLHERDTPDGHDFDKIDYQIIKEMAYELPDTFFSGFGLDKSSFCFGYLSGLSERQPDLFEQFLKRLSEHELASNFGDAVKHTPKRPHTKRNEPIEAVAERYRHGDSEASLELRGRFYAQSFECQTEILKTMLTGDDDDRLWASNLLLNEWWDDDLAPLVGQAWESSRTAECARAVALRCPLSYVMQHQGELEDDDYLSLCLRLASCDGFVADRSRLTRREFLLVMAYNRIHLTDTEADTLLWGHISNYLQPNYKPDRYSSEWNRTFVVEERFLDNYDFLQSEVLGYKPSLSFLPNMTFCVRMLMQTGNFNTIMKFLLWNKRIQSAIPSFLSEKHCQAVVMGMVSECFKAYQDWSWERLMELAIESLPFDRLSLDDDYRFDGGNTAWYDDFSPF